MTPPVVTAAGLSRRYPTARGAVTAVDRISMDVHSGQILGVAGPSGSGKSTLLRLLAGLERPDTGELRYGTRPAWPARSRTVSHPRPGYVMPIFQDPYGSLDSRWPIWRSLTEPLTAPGRTRHTKDQLREIARHWLGQVNLGHLSLIARPSQLSGGQCQRVAILRALIAEPALIVADEPTARQDVVTAAMIGELLRQAAGKGTALVIVSHDTAWLDTLSDHTLRMRSPG